jgi:hypothetical protein
MLQEMMELSQRLSCKDEEDVPPDEWEAGAAALGELWQTLGFRRHTGHLFALDPAEITLDHAVAEFKTHLIPDQK